MSSSTSGTSIVSTLSARLETSEKEALATGVAAWRALHGTVVDGRRVLIPGIGSFELAFGGFSCTIDDGLRASLHSNPAERPPLTVDVLELPPELLERLGAMSLETFVHTLDVLSDTLWTTGSAMIPGALVITAGLRRHPLLPNAPGTPTIEIRSS